MNINYVANFFSILYDRNCRNRPTFVGTVVECGHYLDRGEVHGDIRGTGHKLAIIPWSSFSISMTLPKSGERYAVPSVC